MYARGSAVGWHTALQAEPPGNLGARSSLYKDWLTFSSRNAIEFGAAPSVTALASLINLLVLTRVIECASRHVRAFLNLYNRIARCETDSFVHIYLVVLTVIEIQMRYTVMHNTLMPYNNLLHVAVHQFKNISTYGTFKWDLINEEIACCKRSYDFKLSQ